MKSDDGKPDPDDFLRRFNQLREDAVKLDVSLSLSRLSFVDEQHETAERMRRQRWAGLKGGRAPKHNRDLQDLVNRLAAGHPKATARELWAMIPEADPGGDELIYRDGDKVTLVEDRTGRETTIAYATFRAYVRRSGEKSS